MKDEVGAGKKTDAPTADDDEGAEVDAEEDAEDSDHHQQQRDESPAKNSGGGADSPANAAKLRHRKASKSPARTKADLEESVSFCFYNFNSILKFSFQFNQILIEIFFQNSVKILSLSFLFKHTLKLNGIL